MSSSIFRRALLSAAVCGLLTACGGGGGGDTNAGIGGSGGGPGGGDTQNAGVVGSGGGPRVASVGTITGFGSVFVNGVEYFTSDDFDDNGTDFTTQFNVDGSPREDDSLRGLRIGMVVRIEGELDKNAETGEVLEDSGRALIVVYDDDVEGPVAGIDPYVVNVTTIREFTVLGTSVRVEDGVTVFDDSAGAGLSFATLSDGDVVEISGFTDGNGVLVATRVERKSVAPVGTLEGIEVEVKSSVQSIVSDSQFELQNGLLVNYTAEDLKDGLTAVALNDFYEVKGTLNIDGTEINATGIELEDDGAFDDTEDDAKVSIEGLVSSLEPTADTEGNRRFNINGQVVVFNASTVFEPLSLKDDLIDGIKVEAEGPVSNGELVATKIEARSGMLKVDSLVSAVDATARTVTLDFAAQSILIHADNRTVIRDDNDLPLLLGEVVVGQFMEVEAYASADGRIVATRIERDEIGSPELQARLVSLSRDGSSGVITLRLNETTIINVSTDDLITEFKQLNDEAYSPDQAFFDAVGIDYQAGDLIKVELVSTINFTAEEVEVESSSVTVAAPATSGDSTGTDTGTTDTGTNTTDDTNTNTGDPGAGDPAAPADPGTQDPGTGDDPPIVDNTTDVSGGDGALDDTVTP